MTGGVISPACAITLTTAPTDADFAAIFRRLDRETAPVIGPCHIQPLALLLHGEGGDVTGGLWGRIVYAWLVIEMLFVPAALRGTGTGTSLIRAAEAEARARRCVGIQITRLEFQAPSFYEKRGFTVFGRQDDVPPGHRCFYMEKRLGLPAS
jgi:GNAT superfamily N-acetyltransferase